MNCVPLTVPKALPVWTPNSAHPGRCYLNPTCDRGSQKNSKTYPGWFVFLFFFFLFFWQFTAIVLFAESKKQNLTQMFLLILQDADRVFINWTAECLIDLPVKHGSPGYLCWLMCLQYQCVLFPPEAQGSGEMMGAIHRGRNSFALSLLPFVPPPAGPQQHEEMSVWIYNQKGL